MWPPTEMLRAAMPTSLQKVIARCRHRIEATFGRMELARHGARTFCPPRRGALAWHEASI
jgi:hypothetical protein